MMAAGVRDQGSSLAISTPVSLFDLTTAVTIQFDVTADGQQFLVRRMPNLEGSLPFALVQNWTQLVASGPGPGR
jgi:hypothetical protein